MYKRKLLIGLVHTAMIATSSRQAAFSAPPTLDIGEVKGFIPLRNRRDGMVTRIGEGMTKWRCGDRVGYGLSEFLSQVE